MIGSKQGKYINYSENHVSTYLVNSESKQTHKNLYMLGWPGQPTETGNKTLCRKNDIN